MSADAVDAHTVVNLAHWAGTFGERLPEGLDGRTVTLVGDLVEPVAKDAPGWVAPGRAVLARGSLWLTPVGASLDRGPGHLNGYALNRLAGVSVRLEHANGSDSAQLARAAEANSATRSATDGYATAARAAVSGVLHLGDQGGPWIAVNDWRVGADAQELVDRPVVFF
jgi:hypothetical protein